MRYIYIDLGCYNGNKIRKFLQRDDLVVDSRQFEVYGFEPSTKYRNNWKELEKDFPHNKFVFYEKAVDIKDGTTQYTLNEASPESSTTSTTKRDWGNGKIITVETMDFTEWIKQFKGDYVYVKMNIEGAEFPILTKMIEDDTTQIISQLDIEWHDGKMPQFKSNKDWIWKNIKCEWRHWRG